MNEDADEEEGKAKGRQCLIIEPSYVNTMPTLQLEYSLLFASFLLALNPYTAPCPHAQQSLSICETHSS